MSADPVSRLEHFLELLSDKEQTEVLSDVYRYLLARPDIIESRGRRVPFELSVGNEKVDSRIIVDSIAFGILYEQEFPSKANDHPPDIVAPFGYYTVDEVLDAQPREDTRRALQFLRQNPDEWGDPLHPSGLQETSDLPKRLSRPLVLSAVFGTYVEAAQLQKVTLDDAVAERIERKYT